jgi:hypothetical protein
MKRHIKYTPKEKTWNSPEYKTATIGTPIWTGKMIDDNLVRTGVYLTGLFWLPKKKILIEQRYSIWDNGKGCCKGEHYCEGDPSMYDDYFINRAFDEAEIPLALRSN